MKFLFDLFPILLFFAAYKLWGIYVATGVAIVATFAQVGLIWLRHRRLERSHLITLAIIVVFGGATLYLHNPIFIKWKPTVAYWLFGAAFLGSHFIGEKPLAERMMGHALTVPRPIWMRLNIAWVLFFVAMGLANIYVAYVFDENTWVNFKLFGLMGLTVLFIIAQGFYLGRYMEPEDDSEEQP